MSNFENPYTPAAYIPENQYAPVPKVLDGASKVICILFIVFGSIGSLGLLFSLIAFPALLLIGNSDFGDPKINEAFRDMSNNLSPLVMGVAIVSGIASVVMLIGGVKGIKGQLSGAKLIRNVSGFFLGFKVIETAVQIYLQTQQLEVTKTRMREQMKANPGVDVEMMANIGFIVGMVFMIGIVLVIMGFYLWCFIHMGKASTKQRFS